MFIKLFLNMKVLYANPIFLDYRIPLFKRLNELFNGNFHVLYSPKRYERRFPKVLEKMKQEIPSVLHEFKREYLFNTKTMSFTKHSYEGHNIPFTIGFIRNLKKLSPEIVITEGFLGWTPFVLIYCLLFNRKMIIHYERTCHTERNCSIIATFQRKMFDRFTDAYLVNGTETRKYLESIGIKHNKIYIAGMSSDTHIPELVNALSNEDKTLLKNNYGLNNKDITYLYVGRISRAKGADKLIEAWKNHILEFPNDHLIMAGDGELLSKFCDVEIKGLKLLGRVNYDNIYQLYAIADVFVIATLQDNWSLVVPEAMSCGLPIATSIYNGCHTDLIIDGVDGFVFDPLDNKDIVKTLAKFHSVDLISMGKAAKKMEEPFNISNSSLRIYNTINLISNG